MAAPHLTSAERQDVYRLVFLLNRSFHLIVQRLDELAKNKVFNTRDLTEMRGLTQEIQLEVNTAVLESLRKLLNWKIGRNSGSPHRNGKTPSL